MSLAYLYDAVSWALLRWHRLFAAVGVPADSGLNWTLSIVFLVVTVRLLLFRWVVKQARQQRRLQLLQPEIKALRVKHGDDEAALRREMSALWQAEGANPLAALAPLAVQLPVVIGLLHVLRHLAAAANPAYQAAHPARLTLYGLSRAETLSAADAKLFGGAPLAGRLFDTAGRLAHLGGDLTTTRLVILVVVALSAAATCLTQRLILSGQAHESDAVTAGAQRLARWLVPLGTLSSALFFPLGVLLYWLTSNTWTVAQQAYLNRTHSWDDIPEAHDKRTSRF